MARRIKQDVVDAPTDDRSRKRELPKKSEPALSAVLSIWLPDPDGRRVIHRHLHQPTAPLGTLINCAKELAVAVAPSVIPTLLLTILPSGRQHASVSVQNWIKAKWLAALRSRRSEFRAQSGVTFVWAARASGTGILGLTPQRIETTILASSKDQPPSNFVVCDEPLPYCPPPLASLSGRALSAWRREVGNGHSLPDSLMWHAWAAQALVDDEQERIASPHQMGDSRRVEPQKDTRQTRRFTIEELIGLIIAGGYSEQEIQELRAQIDRNLLATKSPVDVSLADAIAPSRSKPGSVSGHGGKRSSKRAPHVFEDSDTEKASPATKFGKRLREAREARGWTIRRLASEAGMKHSAIARYEAGKRDPSTKNVRRLADALNVALESLL